MDITYIKTMENRNYYLISYINAYSRRVVGWDLQNEQKTKDILEVLKKTLKKRSPGPGLIIHSDKGSQMRSKMYREFCKEHKIVLSYTSWDHSCDENAMQESFHASLKKEAIYQTKIHTKEEAYSVIYNYIEVFYNPIRLHSSLSYFSPVQFEKNPQKIGTIT